MFWLKVLKLKFGTVDTRVAAALAMRPDGPYRVDDRGIKPLIAALSDKDVKVRHAAATALDKSCDERVIAPLLKALENDDISVQLASIRSLGEIGKYKQTAFITDILLKYLKNGHERVRACAATALGELGDLQVVPALFHARANDPSLVSSVDLALGEIFRRFPASAADVCKQFVPDLIELFKSACEKVQFSVVPVLESTQEKNALLALIDAIPNATSLIKERILNCLPGENSGSDWTWVKPETIQTLVRALRQKNSEVRRSAARVLEVIGWNPLQLSDRIILTVLQQRHQEIMVAGPEIIEILVELLDAGGSEDRRLLAVLLTDLGWKPRNAVERVLCAIAHGQYDAAVKEGADAVEPLLAALKEPAFAGKWQARRALAQIGDARGLGALVENLWDGPAHEVNGFALENLVLLGHAGAVPALLRTRRRCSRTIIGEMLTRGGD